MSLKFEHVAMPLFIASSLATLYLLIKRQDTGAAAAMPTATQPGGTQVAMMPYYAVGQPAPSPASRYTDWIIPARFTPPMLAATNSNQPLPLYPPNGLNLDAIFRPRQQPTGTIPVSTGASGFDCGGAC
jgi:hypothetical protein